jgi:putative polyketide hydroxylase
MNRHPKARNLNVRSVEIFRALGIEAAIRKWDFPREARRIMWLESFCGEELAKVSLDNELAPCYSPCEPSFLSQALLEDLLRNSIEEDHVSIQYRTELIDFVEEKESIIATLQKETGETFQVHAKYLLAADGARSPVRKLLDIPVIGREDLGRFVSIYFRADPYPIAPYRPSAAYFMLGEASFGRFIQSVNCKDEWLMGIKLSTEMEQNDSDFHTDYCLQFIRETFEIPDLKIEILDIEFWHMCVQIAQNFRKGRVFLAGDAAHLLSPAGGFGLQTGIQDVHNLCWKLASVIKGQLSEEILDTYHEERFPTVQSNIDWSRSNAKGYSAIIQARKSGDRKKLQDLISSTVLNSIGQDIGFSYQSGLVVPDGTESLAITATQYLPNARPGSRAPHLWLQGPEGVISTIDLFVDSFTLLTDSDGKSWSKELLSMNPALSFRCVSIHENGHYKDVNNDFHALYGIGRGGAVLVRPDGHVYWRAVNSTLL